MNPNKYLSVAILLLFSAFSTTVIAQLSAADIIKQAQQRAAQIDEYRQLLNNPDQSIRVSALDVMLQSDDPAMREIAFNLAFASADDAMRAIALKNKFRYLKTLNFQLSPQENATEGEIKALSDVYSDAYTIQIKDYDPNVGKLSFKSQHIEGQVVGVGLDFQDAYKRCSGSLTLGDGAELLGQLKCTYGSSKGIYRMHLRLQ